MAAIDHYHDEMLKGIPPRHIIYLSWSIYYIIFILTRVWLSSPIDFSKLLGEGEEVRSSCPPAPRRPNWIVLQTFGAECGRHNAMWKPFVNWRYIIVYLFSKRFSTMPNCGPTRRTMILLRGRPYLIIIIKRQNYPPTGAHHLLRSASLWGSTAKLIRSSSTNTPTPCTPWSLTENIVRRHWVVTPGRSWLAKRLRYSHIVTERGSIVIRRLTAA